MKSGEFWFGLAVGALVGAAVALVAAPQTGQETRKDVAEGARKLKDAAAQRGRMVLRRSKNNGDAPDGGETE